MQSKGVSLLIIKYLKDELHDPEEKAAFQSWLAADSKNQQFVDELKSPDHIKESMRFLSHLDEERAWIRVRNRVKRHRLFLNLTRIPKYGVGSVVGIAAAALFILTVGVWYLAVRPVENDVALLVEDQDGRVVEDIQDVMPAEQTAQLVLADGTTLRVADQDITVDDEGIFVGENRQGIYIDHDAQRIPVYHRLVVPLASFSKIVLSDGTKVWLNAKSELRFPAHFSGTERRVLLRGEGFFDVAKDADKPFYVQINGVDIKVLGTQFNVNALGKYLKTTVVEGSVQVFVGQNNTVLKPGQRADVIDRQLKVRIADIAKETAWKEGDFYFSHDNIVYIADQLRLWYDLDIVFQGEIDLVKQYSGVISRKSKLSEVIQMLEHVSDLSFTVQNRKLTIKTKSTVSNSKKSNLQ